MLKVHRNHIAVLLCLALPAASAQATLYHVYLMAGQSNMDGHDPQLTSSLPASLQAPQTNVLYNNSNTLGPTGSYYTGNAWTALEPGVPTATTPNAHYFGPEITFGKKMASDNASLHFAIIKYAVSGSNLAYQWDAPSGGIYAHFKLAVNNALNLLKSEGNTYQIDGMLWLQGEADATDPVKAASYQTNLVNLINDVRTNYGANLHFVIGGIGYETDSSGTTDRNKVRSAFGYAASHLANVKYFDDDDLNASKALHFSPAAMQTIGQRFAAAVETPFQPAAQSTAVPEPAAGLVAMASVGSVAIRRRRPTSPAANG